MGTTGSSGPSGMHSSDAELAWPGRRAPREGEGREPHPATPVRDGGTAATVREDVPQVVEEPDEADRSSATAPGDRPDVGAGAAGGPPDEHQHAGGVDELPADEDAPPGPPPGLDITSLDLGGDVVFITDRNGTIVDVNDAFVRVTGYPRDEAIGASPRLLSSGLQGESFYAALWRTILDGRVWEGQLVDRRRDGSLRTHRVTITPVKDRAGRVTHFVAVERDITAELGRQVVHGSTGLLHTDVTGRCVYADGRAAQLLGRSATQLLGDGLLRSVVEEDASAWREAIGLAVERGRVHRLVVRTAEGGWLRVEAAPLPVASGTVIGATCSVEDIADQLASEREHARRDAMVASLLDTFHDPVAVVAGDGTIDTINAAWRIVRHVAPDHAVADTDAGDDLAAVLLERAEAGDGAAEAIAEDLRRILTGLGTPRERDRVLVRPLGWEEGGAIVRIEGLVRPEDLARHASPTSSRDDGPSASEGGADADRYIDLDA